MTSKPHCYWHGDEPCTCPQPARAWTDQELVRKGVEFMAFCADIIDAAQPERAGEMDCEDCPTLKCLPASKP